MLREKLKETLKHYEMKMSKGRKMKKSKLVLILLVISFLLQVTVACDKVMCPQ